MDRHRIIMHFSTPPSLEDLEAIAVAQFENLPDQLLPHCENLTLVIEDLPDSTIEAEMELDDSYELVALFRAGSHVAPGVQRKVANDDDALLLFRLPLLDIWCETGEDLHALVRQVIVEELARHFEFSDDDIDEMTRLTG